MKLTPKLKLIPASALRSALVWFLGGCLVASSYVNVRLRAQIDEQQQHTARARKLEPVDAIADAIADTIAPDPAATVEELELTKRQRDLIRGCSMT